jgi:hypothetical protein
LTCLNVGTRSDLVSIFSFWRCVQVDVIRGVRAHLSTPAPSSLSEPAEPDPMLNAYGFPLTRKKLLAPHRVAAEILPQADDDGAVLYDVRGYAIVLL